VQKQGMITRFFHLRGAVGASRKRYGAAFMVPGLSPYFQKFAIEFCRKPVEASSRLGVPFLRDHCKISFHELFS
jgi:hypothetical protein